MTLGTKPLEEVGSIVDLTAEMRSAGLASNDHMLHTISINALPAVYEVEGRHLALRDIIGREEISSVVRGWSHRRSRNGKKGFHAYHAGHAMCASDGGGGGGRGKRGGHGQRERRTTRTAHTRR